MAENIGLKLSVVIALVMLATIGVLWSYLPQMIPLLFTYPWGEGRLSPKPLILILPGLVVGIVLVNAIVGKVFGRVSPLLVKMMTMMALFCAVMLAISLFGIIQSLL